MQHKRVAVFHHLCSQKSRPWASYGLGFAMPSVLDHFGLCGEGGRERGREGQGRTSKTALSEHSLFCFVLKGASKGADWSRHSQGLFGGGAERKTQATFLGDGYAANTCHSAAARHEPHPSTQADPCSLLACAKACMETAHMHMQTVPQCKTQASAFRR